ncbi:MAG: glycosyltransferase [Verrucomicrobia bacterium]|nr:glycosyltransferase [Verrucomicrobiota bacterium]
MGEGLRIAFFGSSLLSAYWNGAATYYRGIIRALYQRGHRVTFYEPDAYDRQKHRDIAEPPWAKVVVYPNTREAALREMEGARKADILVKASGVGVFDELLESAALDQRTASNAIVFWDVDAPATLDRMKQDASDPFREKVPQYDLILTYGGGAPVRSAYQQFGARECVPIYNGLDETTHFRVDREAQLESTLAFLGNRLPDRETRVDEFFFRTAETLPEKDFLLGGNGWEGKPMPRNVRSLGHLPTARHNAFNSSPLAVLNISRASMAQYGFSPATRVFEAAGAGSCMISDQWEGIGQFFEPGREILVACDAAAVANHLTALSPERARQIGGSARKRVLAEHTYAHRVLELERLLTGL